MVTAEQKANIQRANESVRARREAISRAKKTGGKYTQYVNPQTGYVEHGVSYEGGGIESYSQKVSVDPRDVVNQQSVEPTRKLSEISSQNLRTQQQLAEQQQSRITQQQQQEVQRQQSVMTQQQLQQVQQQIREERVRPKTISPASEELAQRTKAAQEYEQLDLPYYKQRKKEPYIPPELRKPSPYDKGISLIAQADVKVAKLFPQTELEGTGSTILDPFLGRINKREYEPKAIRPYPELPKEPKPTAIEPEYGTKLGRKLRPFFEFGETVAESAIREVRTKPVTSVSQIVAGAVVGGGSQLLVKIPKVSYVTKPILSVGGKALAASYGVEKYVEVSSAPGLEAKAKVIGKNIPEAILFTAGLYGGAKVTQKGLAGLKTIQQEYVLPRVRYAKYTGKIVFGELTKDIKIPTTKEYVLVSRARTAPQPKSIEILDSGKVEVKYKDMESQSRFVFPKEGSTPRDFTPLKSKKLVYPKPKVKVELGISKSGKAYPTFKSVRVVKAAEVLGQTPTKTDIQLKLSQIPQRQIKVSGKGKLKVVKSKTFGKVPQRSTSRLKMAVTKQKLKLKDLQRQQFPNLYREIKKGRVKKDYRFEFVRRTKTKQKKLAEDTKGKEKKLMRVLDVTDVGKNVQIGWKIDKYYTVGGKKLTSKLPTKSKRGEILVPQSQIEKILEKGELLTGSVIKEVPQRFKTPLEVQPSKVIGLPIITGGKVKEPEIKEDIIIRNIPIIKTGIIEREITGLKPIQIPGEDISNRTREEIESAILPRTKTGIRTAQKQRQVQKLVEEQAILERGKTRRPKPEKPKPEKPKIVLFPDVPELKKRKVRFGVQPTKKKKKKKKESYVYSLFGSGYKPVSKVAVDKNLFGSGIVPRPKVKELRGV